MHDEEERDVEVEDDGGECDTINDIIIEGIIVITIHINVNVTINVITIHIIVITIHIIRIDSRNWNDTIHIHNRIHNRRRTR